MTAFSLPGAARGGFRQNGQNSHHSRCQRFQIPPVFRCVQIGFRWRFWS